MCTAVSYKSKDHYFGRNLDLEYNYQETVTITPRGFPLRFRHEPAPKTRYALIGMATVADNYPLYYDATNEYGLSVAALNFPGNAKYYKPTDSKVNVASFELIPWILLQCKTVSDAMMIIKDINICDTPFSHEFYPSPLHWIVSDRDSSIVLEPLNCGLRIYENPVGVLTNNPPFDFHLHHLSNYLHLSHAEPGNNFSDKVDLIPYSRGMGAIGLPGDLSSASRFIKAAFTKLNSVCDGSENDSISQFFHILNAVAQQRGCVKIGNAYEKTIYSSCCNTDKCIYYYTTYTNSQITGIALFHEDLDSTDLICYPLKIIQQIRMEN